MMIMPMLMKMGMIWIWNIRDDLVTVIYLFVWYGNHQNEYITTTDDNPDETMTIMMMILQY